MNTASFLETYQAGFVKRHHTNPSDAVQTVAAHSWGVAMVLDYIWPEATKAALLAAIRHDVAERWTGDAPAFVKWRYPEIAMAYTHAEMKVEELIGYESYLTEMEATALKLADLLELWLFSCHRCHMGDSYFRDVRSNVESWFKNNSHYFNHFPKALEFQANVLFQRFASNPT